MKNLIISACMCFALIGPAGAVQPVFDAKGLAEAQAQLAKLKEQIKVAQNQLSTLTDMKGQIEEQLKAFGEMGSINIPTLSFSKIAGQVTGNTSCLVPDYKELMPSIGETEIDFGSVCSRGNVYKKGLIVNRADVKKMSPAGKREAFKAVRKQRKKTSADATTKGLAHADMAIESSVETVRAAQELKNSARGATTVNDRLQVISETNIALLQSQALTNQLLAQILKVQSAYVIEAVVSLESELAIGDDD